MPKNPEVRLVASTSVSNWGGGDGIVKLMVTPCYLDAKGEVRSFGQHDYPYTFSGDYLADLALSGQANLNEDGPFYGLSVAYREVYEVNAVYVELMAKTLRKVTKSFTKLSEEFGSPRTVKDYIAFLSRTLRAVQVGFLYPEVRANGSRYAWSGIDQTVYAIESALNDARKKN